MGLAHPESETSFSSFWIRRTTTQTLPRHDYGLLTEPRLRQVVVVTDLPTRKVTGIALDLRKSG